MRLKYKKFWHNSISFEKIELGENTSFYKTEYIGNIKYNEDHEFGESFDYIILTDFSEEIYDSAEETFDYVYKIRDKIFIIALTIYIDESDYKVSPKSEFPKEILKGCYLITRASNYAINSLSEQEQKEYLKHPFVAISKVTGLGCTGFKCSEVTVAGYLTLNPYYSVTIDRVANFNKIEDNYSEDSVHVQNYKDIFTDEDLSDLYHKYLQEIYEKAY